MGIIIDDREFDPRLRSRIAAFIDAFFEEPSVDGGAFEENVAYEAAEPMMAAGIAADEPSRPSASSRFARGNMADAFGRAFGSLKESREKKAADASSKACDFIGAPPCEGADSLTSWLDQIDEPFSTTLLALIDRKGLTDVDVYKRAHMSRQLFSRIRSDASYRPAKKTVLALAIALELSLDEMRDLLARAGFALTRSNKRDLIVEYFVTNGIYDLFAINEALYEFDQPLI